MPEPSSLERTARAAREIAAAVRVEPEVTDYQVYVGTAAPFNFNGLVRHYFMRQSANMADIQVNLLPRHDRKAQSHDIALRVRPRVRVLNASMPETDAEPAMKWDGEWHISIEVFRDLGLAFIVALVLIYLLMTGWFASFTVPLIVMAAIPFSLIGILPAHAGMGAFFSATSMIGFIAGAGIVVRNSIILVDFIELRLREGMPLDRAVIDAGAVRFRPMLLTAMAVVVGAAVILFDPIFQGLAISLMAGEVASLFVSRMAVPVLYYMARK